MGNLCASVPKTADNGSVAVNGKNITAKQPKKELTSEMADSNRSAPVPKPEVRQGLVLEDH